MSTIGIYHLTLVENAGNALTVTYAGVSDATGWAARLDIRTADDPDATLLVSLTSPSGGIALSIVAGGLQAAISLTETQTDTVVAAVVAQGRPAAYSLKLTPPAAETIQPLKGSVRIERTATP